MDNRSEIITSLRLAERAITQLLQELQELTTAQRDDHEALVRLQEQQAACQAATTTMLATVERIVRGNEGTGGGLLQAVHDLQRGLALVQEQNTRASEAAKETRSSQVIQTGNTMQALSTVIAALIGAAAGVASLLMQYRGGAGH